MIKLKYYFLLFIGLSSAPNLAAQTASEVLKSSFEALNGHSSVTYDLIYKNKKFWSADTTTYIAKCNILRTTEKDGYFWTYFNGKSNGISGEDEVEYQSYEVVRPLAPVIESYEDDTVLIEMASLRPSLPHGTYAHPCFLNPKQLLDFQEADLTLKTEKWNGKNYFKVEVRQADNFRRKDRNIQFWINKTTFQIHRIFHSFQYKTMEGVHFDDWQFDNIAIDTLTETTILERKEKIDLLRILYDYDRVKLFDYSNVPDNMRGRYFSTTNPLLQKGTLAPSFEGWNFIENRTVNSSEFLGSPMVVVFWNPYRLGLNKMDSVILFLNKIQLQFASKGVMVLGLVQKSEMYPNEYLYDLVEVNNMKFQNLTIESSVNEIYGTIGFPEIYVIDENGEIVQTFIGFHESYKSKILKFLDDF